MRIPISSLILGSSGVQVREARQSSPWDFGIRRLSSRLAWVIFCPESQPRPLCAWFFQVPRAPARCLPGAFRPPCWSSPDWTPPSPPFLTRLRVCAIGYDADGEYYMNLTLNLFLKHKSLKEVNLKN